MRREAAENHMPTVPASSPVDDALDRLRQQINKSRATYVPGTPEKYPATELRGLTVLEAEALLAQAEQLREERDAERERFARHVGTMIEPKLLARVRAAEAEMERLTEGLREIERYSQERLDDGHPGLLDMHLVNDKARALLADSPDGGSMTDQEIRDREVGYSPDGANTEGGEA